MQAVIADSFARIFYRNAVNNAFYAVELPGISRQVQDGDLLEVDIVLGEVTNLTQGQTYSFPPFSPFVQGIYQAGGLLKSIAAAKSERDVSHEN